MERGMERWGGRAKGGGSLSVVPFLGLTFSECLEESKETTGKKKKSFRAEDAGAET